MNGLESFWSSYGWVVFLILVFLCCVGMKGRRGSRACGFPFWGTDKRGIHSTDSAIEILDKRYALGELTREEYEERKKDIGQGRQ